MGVDKVTKKQKNEIQKPDSPNDDILNELLEKIESKQEEGQQADSEGVGINSRSNGNSVNLEGGANGLDIKQSDDEANQNK